MACVRRTEREVDGDIPGNNALVLNNGSHSSIIDSMVNMLDVDDEVTAKGDHNPDVRPTTSQWL